MSSLSVLVSGKNERGKSSLNVMLSSTLANFQGIMQADWELVSPLLYFPRGMWAALRVLFSSAVTVTPNIFRRATYSPCDAAWVEWSFEDLRQACDTSLCTPILGVIPGPEPEPSFFM